MASELTFGTDFGPDLTRPRPLPYAASLTDQYPIGVRVDCSLRAGLIPFQSPLLRESLLVSFPPLSDMLKFRGYSPLRRGRRKHPMVTLFVDERKKEEEFNATSSA